MEFKDQLAGYVTNTDRSVYAIKGLDGVVGAVMARYSRAETGLRETLAREFVEENNLDLDHAASLIERVLIAYGDDSVGELEGAHLAFEDISLVATKVIEHRRIGGSPIEQSTRYVRYDKPHPETGYRYFTPPALQGEDKQRYCNSMDALFERYGDMWKPLVKHLKSLKPLKDARYDVGGGEQLYESIEDSGLQKAFKRTWNNDIKTKACDVLRAFLPLATLANVGLFGNGRYFQHLISRMLTSPHAEANVLGRLAHEELSKVIPHYVKRAKIDGYQQENHKQMQAFVTEHFSDIEPETNTDVSLISPDYKPFFKQDGTLKDPSRVDNLAHDERRFTVMAAMVFEYTRASFKEIRQRLHQMSPDFHERLVKCYYGDRQTRRDRPGRALETGYPYTFELVTEWAVYKDLMRHRMSQQLIQPLKPDLGFVMPEIIHEAGLTDIAEAVVGEAEALFRWLESTHPNLTDYAFLQGHRMRWLIGLNDRALMHMLELRTTPQGHENYRIACQQMHLAVAEVDPGVAKGMCFVNHEPVFWSRGESEARQRIKEAKLGYDETV